MNHPTPPNPPWLIELPSCDSTSSWALAHAEALAHGACVWTRVQTRGRGRGGSRWHAPPGVLTASFIVDPPRRTSASDRLSRQMSLAAGLAVAHAVEDLAPGARVMIKWPNDCYLSDRKLAGILCERAAGSSRLVVGIGLNLDPRWDQMPETLPFAAARTASVAEARADGVAPDMVATLIALRRYLLEAAGLVAAGSWKRLLEPLRERDWLRERVVVVRSGDTTTSGRASGLDAEGRLLVQPPDERRQACAGGSVTVRASAGSDR